MQTLDLNGNWKLGWSDGQRHHARDAHLATADIALFIDAVVPGEVHLDLLRTGAIKEPNIGLHALEARWVEECLWFYRREFEAPPVTGRTWLVFDQLDLCARIYLNGDMIGTHDNAFVPCRIDVTDKLLAHNTLVVRIESGLFSVADRPTDGQQFFGDQPLHKRHWLRKPQYQFGWDWTYRLINVGISGGVRLEVADDFVMREVVVLPSVSDDLLTGHVHVRAFVDGVRAGTERLRVRIGDTERSVDVDVSVGENEFVVDLDVPTPRLWWPVGTGDPNLYDVEVVLGNTVVRKQVGFRRVRVDQSPHPETGRYFVLEINNRPVFCKGGNFVPADMILSRVDRDRYEALTDLSLEANQNFLRVWGGGQYESEDFYDCCDRKGILVWQEFIFACSRYPGYDEGWLESVRREARFQVRRLANRASLVVWCGNNEIEWLYEGDEPDHHVFHDVLPAIVGEEDGTRFYLPSSPMSPDSPQHNAEEEGDQHPWSIGFEEPDFRKYRAMACRYPNEGGILGPASLPTMVEALPEDERFVYSPSFHLHDNIISASQPSHADNLVYFHTGLDVRSMSLEEYAYWGGLIEGEGLREYIENFRRRMFSSASAVFWMYNDSWPVTRGWTIVDYYLRRTPAFHPARRAFAPVHVIAADDGDSVGIYGVNDTNEPVACDVRFGVFDTLGGFASDETHQVALAPNASTKLGSTTIAQPDRQVAFAQLEGGARSRLALPVMKDLKLGIPQVEVEVRGGRAVFSSDIFVWGVCLDLDGGPYPADNFFDVWPGIEYSIPWTSPEPPAILFTGNSCSTHR